MPSNRRLKSDDVDGFMLAFWDSWRDLEAEFDCTVRVEVVALEQRGHVRVCAAADKAVDGGAVMAVAESEIQWPTSQAASVHALLYALLMRLWKELRDYRAMVHAQNSAPLN